VFYKPFPFLLLRNRNYSGHLEIKVAGFWMVARVPGNRFASLCLDFGRNGPESMVEQKLFRSHQAPEHVLESDASLNLAGPELIDKFFQFIIRWVTR